MDIEKTNDVKSSIKKKNNINVMPFTFLILIILSTIWIYSYNYYYELENIKLDEKIAEVTKDIEDINKDKNIQVYNVIEKNTKILNKLDAYSQITKFMDSIAYIEKVYWLKISNFSYSNWMITTEAETYSRISSTPYLSVSRFIEKYRKDDKVAFTLPFISKVTGSDKIKFSLKLKVKDSLIKNNTPNKK